MMATPNSLPDCDNPTKSPPLLLLIGLVQVSGLAQNLPKFRLTGIVSDHTILQQDKPITIWG